MNMYADRGSKTALAQISEVPRTPFYGPAGHGVRQELARRHPDRGRADQHGHCDCDDCHHHGLYHTLRRVHSALHACCSVVLHLRCSLHRHEPPRHLVGEHRRHGVCQRGLLLPRHACHTQAWHSGLALTRCDVVHGRGGHAKQGGHVEHWCGGLASTLHGKGVCGWFQEDAGFRDMRQQAARRLVRQGHSIRIIKQKAGNHCTSPHGRVFMGVRVTLCKVAMLNSGVKDTLATTRL